MRRAQESDPKLDTCSRLPPTHERLQSLSGARFLSFESCMSVIKDLPMMRSPPPPRPPTPIIHAGPQSKATIRRCLYRDLDRILPIYNHYVSHTIVSFDLNAKPIVYMQKLYNSVLDQDLPFLVVTTNDNDDPAHRKREAILGYAYAHFYRRLPAFGGTVEILIYLDPSATGQGIGERLLKVLMIELKAVTPGTDRDHGIREVLAIVPVDEGRDASRLREAANPLYSSNESFQVVSS